MYVGSYFQPEIKSAPRSKEKEAYWRFEAVSMIYTQLSQTHARVFMWNCPAACEIVMYNWTEAQHANTAQPLLMSSPNDPVTDRHLVIQSLRRDPQAEVTWHRPNPLSCLTRIVWYQTGLFPRAVSNFVRNFATIVPSILKSTIWNFACQYTHQFQNLRKWASRQIM